MKYDDFEVRVRERNGEKTVEIDGFHRVQPESKPTEYRRIAVVDLSAEQTRNLHDRLGTILSEWDAESTDDQ
jgi:hypothetical protein